jgi:RNA polymerase sigma-70 factor (ECF subfamily)
MLENKDKLNNDLKEDKFFRIFSLNQSEIFSYIVTLVPHSVDADDVFQETCAVMWRKFDQFQTGSNFAAWGCRIAYYVILERRRQSRQSPLNFSSEVLEFLSDSYKEHQSEQLHRIEYLDDCLKKLPEKERLVIHLRYNKVLSVQAIADQIGKSSNLIYKVIGKIHYFLFECIQRNIASESRP